MRREDQLALLKSTPLDEQTINALMEAFGSPRITKDAVDEAWEKFCSWYPRRKGDPAKAAYEKFRKIVATGVDPEALAHTAKGYYRHCESEKILGTKYVLQRSTFLTQAAGRYEEFLPKGEEHKWTLEAKCVGDIDPRILSRWTGICERLARELGEAKYRAWFDKLILSKISEDSVELMAGSKFTADYVSQHFGSRLSELWGRPVRVVS